METESLGEIIALWLVKVRGIIDGSTCRRILRQEELAQKI